MKSMVAISGVIALVIFAQVTSWIATGCLLFVLWVNNKQQKEKFRL